MGSHMSRLEKEATARSDAIDRQIEADSKQYRRECKVLVLGLFFPCPGLVLLVLSSSVGTHGSGKSTIIKQMKIVHSQDQLLSFRPTIYWNVLESAKAVVRTMQKLDLIPVHSSNNVLAEKIRDYRLETTDFILSPEIANAIHGLCLDPVVNWAIAELSNDIHPMDDTF
jgi:guanine nucleotide-binding protein G(i) subunit alpha